MGDQENTRFEELKARLRNGDDGFTYLFPNLTRRGLSSVYAAARLEFIADR
ncbi:MAG: hypothetical protein ACREU5_11810 [Burkholderiales bacterium]